uniref:SAP domain-containing protein n=1 Tax=Macrostomum lignano TaxID=282301 RepID=A0A1I8F3U9_9PLAT
MPGAKKQQQQQQDYSQLKLTELRELCHNRGIKVSGRKSELIDRLINLDSNGHDSNNSSNTIAGHSKKKAAAAAATDSFGFSVAYRGALVDSGAGGSGSGGFDSSSTATMENNDHLSRTESQFQLRQLAKERERAERDRLVLWRRPFATVYYALLECNFLLTNLIIRLPSCSLLLMALAGLRHVEGPHRRYLDIVEDTGLWCSWWIWLGILSSVGLGTGLHTFLIYLGPHIARVTLAAYECRTLDFPQPPYPAEIGCPSETVPDTVLAPSIWAILSKVRLEAFSWGAGTAIGELPPYFLARAARLSCCTSSDIWPGRRLPKTQLPFSTRVKLLVHNLVQRLGFWGILLCASIQNPLFDLAGITCGHFLIPFQTFFFATLIGKAVIKMHLQMLFVVFAFSPHLVERLATWIGGAPLFGQFMESLIRDLLEKQRRSLHRPAGGEAAAAAAASSGSAGRSLLQQGFELLVAGMILYFLVSIVNSFAQSYYKRQYHRDKAVRRAEETAKFY